MNPDDIEDRRELFLAEMQGVERLKPTNRAVIEKPRASTPGQEERRRAAQRLRSLDANHLSVPDDIPLLRGHDVIAWRKDGVQHGVFRNLSHGCYPIHARLDLHNRSVAEARQEVWQFVRDCMRHELRTVIIVHGRGERNPGQGAIIKSYVDHWLRDLPDVLAFHSAVSRHGGTGAVYVLLRKSEGEKQRNRERFGSK